MSIRPAHAAKLVLFAMLANLFLAVAPAQLPFAIAAKADPSIGKTGLVLPTIGERLGLSDKELPEPSFTAPDPQQETGPELPDGTYRLPPNYVENPDYQAPPAAGGQSFATKKESRGGKKNGGPIPMLAVGGSINSNTTWALADSPIEITSNVTVSSPATLTIEPGVVVKADAGTSLTVLDGATITANGTTGSLITFTSIKDDSVGGDLNGDGSATTPAPGDWDAIYVAGYKDGSNVVHPAFGSFTNVVMRYGQKLSVRYSRPTMSYTSVSKMSGNGIYFDSPANTALTWDHLTVTDNDINLNLYAVPSLITITNSVFRGATGLFAVEAQASSAAKITNSAIERNGGTSTFYAAVKSYSSAITLQYDSIANNRRTDGSDWGVDSAGATVAATSNWWGSTSGPEVSGQSATGGGSKITTSVTYTSWLGSAFEADHKRGNLPWALKAGVGADVASGNFVFAEKDLSIPTIGFPLEVTRTYNNQIAGTVTGDFGYGWTWNYGTNLNLSADANGGVTWEQPDGAKNYFHKNNGDGSYTAEQGIYSVLTYDAATSTYTLTHKDQTKWVFNSTGKLIKQIDTCGNITVIARDGTGKITTVTEPTGRTLTVLYSGSFISKITDPLGRTLNYTYGSANSVTGVTKKEPDGTTVYNTCSYTYTGAATAMTGLTDCEGNVLTQTFDASTPKRVATQTWNGATPATRFTYGPATDAPTGLVLPQYSTGVWDTYGKANIYYYTKSNKVTEHWLEKQIIGGTYYWYYEDLWSFVSYLSTSYRDIDGKTTTYSYDWQAGNLLSKTEPGSRTTTYTYDAFNNRTSATDNLSRLTQFFYDSEQHLTKITDALSHDTVTTYTAAGLPDTVTDARGKVTGLTYDSYGYPATVTNAAGEVLTFSYDAGGRKLWEETPTHKRTTYTYNGLAEVLTATDPLSHITTTVYDTSGRKTSVTDAASHATTFSYNRNALWKTTDAKNGVVEFTLDNQGNVATVKDALGHVTTFTWDQFGRKLTEKDANNKTFAYEYTYSGRISKVTDAANQATTYTYTTANDLDTISYSDGRSVVNTYDGVGNRLTMIDWVGTHSASYDALNRVTSATDGSGNTIGYTYDAAGNLATITYPGSKTVTYTYDDANRMATVTDWDGRVTTYSIDATGRIGSFTLPNGVVTTYGYDDASRMSHVDHTKGATTIAARDYTFDNLGNRLTKVSTAGTESETYDELYRITGVTYADGAQSSYGYDATGNRSSQTIAGLSTSYNYDPADQLLSAGDGLRTYDANGQLTQIGADRGFTWDPRGKLTGITDSPTNTAPTANAGSTQSVWVNRLTTLDGSASSDPEGETLSYSWTEDGTNPATGLLRGIHAPKPGFTPTIAGTYGFHLTVSDGVNTSTAAAVTITVQSGVQPNQTLTSTATGAASGFVYSNVGTMFNNDIKAGKNVTTLYEGIAQFVLPTVPAGMYLSSAALDLMGKSATGSTSGDAWSVRLLPTSLDAGWASTTWALISGATPDSTLTPVLTGTGQVVANVANHWNFASGDLSVLTSRLAVSGKLSIRTDGNNASSTSYVTWYGGNATTASNRPKLTLVFSPNPEYDHVPFARAGLDQKVAPSTLMTLHGEDSYDYEGAVTYAWTQTGGPTVSLSSSTAATPTLTPTAEGTYRFSLVVTDSATQASTADEVVVRASSSSPPHATSYAYDGDGDRISQTNDGVTTSYVVNSVPKLAAVLMETTGSATTYYIYGQDLLYSLKADGPHYHHADSLGSTIAVTDSTGAVEQTMDYDIFGAMRTSTGTNGTTYTFTGEENDISGLVYLRARFYDPAQGRFISRDPYPMKIADTQTVNRYAYVGNNPTNHIDPSGKCGFCVEAILGIIELLPEEVQVFLLGTGAPAAAAGAHVLTIDSAGEEDFTPPAQVIPRGFQNAEDLMYHAAKHGPDFGATENYVDYDQLTRDFFAKPINGLLEKVRANGDIVRYDPESNAFGVMRADGFTRTLFKPSLDFLRNNGPYNSFLDYFNAQ
jgi:RHS repeat-associated protein